MQHEEPEGQVLPPIPRITETEPESNTTRPISNITKLDADLLRLWDDLRQLEQAGFIEPSDFIYPAGSIRFSLTEVKP